MTQHTINHEKKYKPTTKENKANYDVKYNKTNKTQHWNRTTHTTTQRYDANYSKKIII